MAVKDKSEIIAEIKKKKELSGLANSLVSDNLDSYIKKYKISIENLSPKQLKVLIKDIRAILRNQAGRFQKSFKKITQKEEYSIEELLRAHASTAERMDFYPKLKSIIKSLKVNSILDIGCGLNPIALADKKIYYHASDINEEYLSLVSKFFKKNNIKGEVFVYDIRNPNSDLPKADICLLFKLLDVVGAKNHKMAKAILERLNYKYILVSFATKTLSGKEMKRKRRIWFESLLKELNYNYEIFSSNNEIFYLIKKLA